MAGACWSKGFVPLHDLTDDTCVTTFGDSFIFVYPLQTHHHRRASANHPVRGQPSTISQGSRIHATVTFIDAVIRTVSARKRTSLDNINFPEANAAVGFGGPELLKSERERERGYTRFDPIFGTTSEGCPGCVTRQKVSRIGWNRTPGIRKVVESYCRFEE